MNPEHIGLFSALLAAGVEFAVVRGVAVIAYGVPRTTQDLDLFVRPTISNVQAASRALEAYVAPTAGMSLDKLATGRHRDLADLEDLEMLPNVLREHMP